MLFKKILDRNNWAKHQVIPERANILGIDITFVSKNKYQPFNSIKELIIQIEQRVAYSAV